MHTNAVHHYTWFSILDCISDCQFFHYKKKLLGCNLFAICWHFDRTSLFLSLMNSNCCFSKSLFSTSYSGSLHKGWIGSYWSFLHISDEFLPSSKVFRLTMGVVCFLREDILQHNIVIWVSVSRSQRSYVHYVWSMACVADKMVNLGSVGFIWVVLFLKMNSKFQK